MEQEYKVGLFGKIFYGFCAGAAMMFFIMLMLSHPPVNNAMYLIPIFITLLCTLVIINLFTSKVVITDTSITRERIFYKKQVAIADILGYRNGQKYVRLETTSGESLTIRNYDDFYRSGDLMQWIGTNFTDLDKIDYKAQENKMLQDETIGVTEPERKENLDKAKQIALAYNIWGFMIPFIAIVAQQSYIMAIIGIISPLLGILFLNRDHHIIKFLGDSAKSPYPSIGFGFIFSVASILLVALIDDHLLFFQPILLPAIVIAVALFILLYKSGLNTSALKIKTQVTAMAITSIAYGFGFSVLINSVFDYSTPMNYKSSVIYAYTTNGKGGKHFYFTIAAWKGQQNARNEGVNRQQYLSIPIGTKVNVYQKKGLFNAAWYYIVFPITTPPVPAGSNNGNSPAPR